MSAFITSTRVSVFGLVWSAGTSAVVALTIQGVPALVVPVLASALLLAAGPSREVRRTLGIAASLMLLVFMLLAMLSVGWFYLPSFAAAIDATTRAEREAAGRER